MPGNYTGKKLRGSPFKPEVNLEGANFSKAILRGVNFQGLSLKGTNFRNADVRGVNFRNADIREADFENADIRGANFENTNLANTNFTRSRAGLRHQDIIGLLVVLVILAAIAGFISAYVGYTISYQSHSIDPAKKVAATASLLVVLTFFILSIRTNIGITLWITLVVLAIVNAPISLFTNTAVTAAGAIIGCIVGAFTIVAAIVLISRDNQKFNFAIALIFIGIASAVSICTGNFARNLIELKCQDNISISAFCNDLYAFKNAGIHAGVLTSVLMILSTYIAWKTLRGSEKYLFIQETALAFASVSGTNFFRADLSSANFKEAILKNTNLSSAIIKKTCWLEAKQLDRAKVDASILSDVAVRDLLVTGKGYKKIYVGANLYGANLNGANLESSNLKGANLSHALLQQACLKDANLSETLATETDFTGAYLTGACIEAWNIDQTTILKNVDCQFVFLLQDRNILGSRERRPHDPSKVFHPGDFEKLYRKIMSTVQILLRDGVNREAFAAAFQKLMTENPEITPNAIQSIEKKDNDVLLTLQVPATADKAKIEQQFDDAYQAKLAAQTNAALLAAEQRHNQDLKELFLKKTENLKLSELLSNLTIITGDHIVTDNKYQGITASDGSFINTGTQTLSNSIVNLSGNVSNALNRLADNEPSQAELKSLLAQLQIAIETTPDLPDPDKADALEQVGVLATLGSNPPQPDKEGLGRKAIKILKGTIAMLPSTATLVKAISELLPTITKLMGL
jgi:uncharacterized protein YjbI with pentapeptide repeats